MRSLLLVSLPGIVKEHGFLSLLGPLRKSLTLLALLVILQFWSFVSSRCSQLRDGDLASLGHGLLRGVSMWS